MHERLREDNRRKDGVFPGAAVRGILPDVVLNAASAQSPAADALPASWAEHAGRR